MTNSHSNRRTFLSALAVTGALGVFGARSQAQDATTIELGGDTGGWIGRSPESIADTRNPTLELEPGQTYEIVWENVDGARHNVVILNENRDRLVRSELISQEGATQTVEFEATEEMSEYLCEAHPETMVAGIETAGANGEQADQPETTTEADGAENQTTTQADGNQDEAGGGQNETDGGQGGAEEEETEVPEARDPQEAVEGTPEADPEVNQDALSEFQDGNATDGGTNGTDEETDVPEARDPDEAENGTPESAPEVPDEQGDGDGFGINIDVSIIFGGEGNRTTTGQESRGLSSTDRSGFGTLGVLGGLASAGAVLRSRGGNDEE